MMLSLGPCERNGALRSLLARLERPCLEPKLEPKVEPNPLIRMIRMDGVNGYRHPLRKEVLLHFNKSYKHVIMRYTIEKTFLPGIS